MSSIQPANVASPLTAQEKLSAAVLKAQAGQYQDALDIHIWFHHNALKEEPALMGVRLSFALAYWTDLASHFPPALVELQKILEQQTQHVLQQCDDRPEFFYEVEAINQYLNSGVETYQLFKAIEQSNPNLAKACARRVMPWLLEHHDYTSAVKYIPADLQYYTARAQELNQDVADINVSSEHKSVMLDTIISLFLEDLRQLRVTWRQAQQLVQAEQIIEHSLSAIEPIDLQQKVRDIWVGSLEK